MSERSRVVLEEVGKWKTGDSVSSNGTFHGVPLVQHLAPAFPAFPT